MSTILPQFDPRNTEHIARQVSAVGRFSAFIAANTPEFDSTTLEALQVVLDTYRLELARLLAGIAPSNEHMRSARWSRYIAVVVADKMLNANPALRRYRPSDPAQTVEQAALNLLAHSLAAFGELADEGRHDEGEITVAS